MPRYEPLSEDEMIRLTRDLADDGLTPGPWYWQNDSSLLDDSLYPDYLLVSSSTGRQVIRIDLNDLPIMTEADRNFIAWARMLVPRLVETVRMREARVRVLEARLKRQMEETARAQGTELPEIR